MQNSAEPWEIKEFLSSGILSERWARPSPLSTARSSRPSNCRPPMSRDAHREEDMPSTSGLQYDENAVISTVLHRLEEKEKDLELAAKIGNSLLEQNKELQERNEFLEESLHQSNESVVQLRHQLKQRSSLFYAIANLDDDDDEEEGEFSVSNSRTENSHTRTQHLETRLKSLENENRNLKGEASKLEDYTSALEKKERERVKDYLGQLEKANLKIGRLQEQIIEKNKECALQAEETEKLVKEIGQRKNREKALIDANDDLSAQLHTAISSHETLKLEVSALQDSYFDVMGMLRETEDELRGYRQRATLYRTSSADSLYDSLASELEASDSGCYNTPMFSARCESQQSSSQQRYPELLLGAQLSDLEPDPLMALEEASEDMESQLEIPEGEHQSSSSSSSFDVPTRALVNAVRSARDVRSLPDSVRSMDKELRSDEEEADKPVHVDELADLNTPLGEAMSFSTISFQSSISTKTVVPSASDSTKPAFDIVFQAPTPQPTKTNTEPKLVKTEEKKVYRDMSTSPINFDKIPSIPDESSNKTPKPKKKMLKTPKQWTECSTAPSCSSSSSSSCSNETLCSGVEKSFSSDSLGGYSAPKLGEPGRPGTRDLEFSIRRLNLRKQIERNYQIFRQQRGLTPAKFYSTPFPNISTNSRSILDKEHMEEGPQTGKPLTSKIVRDHPIRDSSSQWLLSNCHSPLSSLRPWVTQGKLQQCWKGAPPPSKHPPPLELLTKEGILLRSVEKDSAHCVPRSGSCSRLDKILRQLVEEPDQPQSLTHQQPIIMRPTLASLLLFKNQRLRRFPQLLPANLDHRKAAISRGTSPVADFGFSTNILGLNAMSGEQALTSSPGILQRFH